MDGLLGLPREKITADIQAFADDIALLARGHDANILRDITQKILGRLKSHIRINEKYLNNLYYNFEVCVCVCLSVCLFVQVLFENG